MDYFLTVTNGQLLPPVSNKLHPQGLVISFQMLSEREW